MQVAIAINHAGQQFAATDLARFALRAEALGFEALLSGDHTVLPLDEQYDYPYSYDGAFGHSTREPAGHLIESMSVLSYLAAITTRIRLGTSVMVLPYRTPIIAAKMWAALDVLSNGRAICGVGIGWSERAFEALGIPFHERGAITDEYLQVMRRLWEDDQPSFEGQYCRFSGIGFYPKPIQRPLPVWVGGHSREAIRRTARFAQCWHVSRMSKEYVADMLPFIAECARAEGRDPADIGISLKRRIHFTDLGLDPTRAPALENDVVGSVDEVVADALACRAIGITNLAYDFRTPLVDEQLAIMERLAAYVIPAVAG